MPTVELNAKFRLFHELTDLSTVVIVSDKTSHRIRATIGIPETTETPDIPETTETSRHSRNDRDSRHSRNDRDSNRNDSSRKRSKSDRFLKKQESFYSNGSDKFYASLKEKLFEILEERFVQVADLKMKELWELAQSLMSPHLTVWVEEDLHRLGENISQKPDLAREETQSLVFEL